MADDTALFGTQGTVLSAHGVERLEIRLLLRNWRHKLALIVIAKNG
jgi:hypothetical protein